MSLPALHRTALAIVATLLLAACEPKAQPGEQSARQDTASRATQDSTGAHPTIGYDSRTVVSEAPDLKCYELARYFVVEQSSPNEVGTDILVRLKTEALMAAGGASQRCTADSLSGDYVVRNEWAEYFSGMRNEWLFLDSGTGPQRATVLHNVDTRKRVLAVVGDHGGWHDSLTILIWVDKGEQPLVNCPGIREGLGAGLDSLFALDLRTVSLTSVGRARCSARQ